MGMDVGEKPIWRCSPSSSFRSMKSPNIRVITLPLLRWLTGYTHNGCITTACTQVHPCLPPRQAYMPRKASCQPWMSLSPSLLTTPAPLPPLSSRGEILPSLLLHDQQRDVIINDMLTDVVSHVIDDRLPNFPGRLLAMAPNLLAQALKPIQLARGVFCFGHTIRVEGHHIPQVQTEFRLRDKGGDILLESDRKSQIDRIDALHPPIGAHHHQFLMLTADAQPAILIVEQDQGQVLVGLHTLDIFINRAIQGGEKPHGVGFSVG